MSSPYYGPDEDENTILLERNFLAGDVASGTGYGKESHASLRFDLQLPSVFRYPTRLVYVLCTVPLEEKEGTQKCIIPLGVHYCSHHGRNNIRDYSSEDRPSTLRR